MKLGSILHRTVLGIALLCTGLMMSGCSGFKQTVVGDGGKPLSSYVMLVTSPNIISIPAGKTISAVASLDCALFSGINYDSVIIKSSRPDVGTVVLDKSTTP